MAEIELYAYNVTEDVGRRYGDIHGMRQDVQAVDLYSVQCLLTGVDITQHITSAHSACRPSGL